MKRRFLFLLALLPILFAACSDLAQGADNLFAINLTEQNAGGASVSNSTEQNNRENAEVEISTARSVSDCAQKVIDANKSANGDVSALETATNVLNSAINKLHGTIINAEPLDLAAVENVQKAVAAVKAAIENLDKYYVVVVAGQSNAVGYDESPITVVSADKNRIKQLGYHTNNKQLIPLGTTAESFQDMRNFGYGGTGGIHLPLANLILPRIPSDYGVVVIPAAFGGTGFSSNRSGGYNEDTMKCSGQQAREYAWGVGANQYKAMVDRLKFVLDMNPKNKFIGVVWIQGEQDSTNDNAMNANLTQFPQMVDDFCKQMNQNYASRATLGAFSKDNWFNVETTCYWFDSQWGYGAASVERCKKIWGAYEAWNPSTYVKISRDINLTNKARHGPNGGTWNPGVRQVSSALPSHFGNGAYEKEVAPKVFEKMKEKGVI